MLSFEVLEAPGGRLAVSANEQHVEIPLARGPGTSCEVDLGRITAGEWLTVTLSGDALVRDLRLAVADARVQDARSQRLESVRPEWMGEKRPVAWDLARRRPLSAFQRPGNVFHFHVPG